MKQETVPDSLCPCGEYWKTRCRGLGRVLLLVELLWVGSVCGLVWYFVPRLG